MNSDDLKKQILDKGMEYAKFLHTALPAGRHKGIVMNTMDTVMYVALDAVKGKPSD